MNPERNWYPVSLESRHGQLPEVVWQNLDGVTFTDPFFEDTLRRCRQPGNVLRRTPLVVLAGHPPPPFLPPKAFIFHASRCGSTLLVQLLGQLPGTVVMAEPPVLDAVFRAPVDDGDKMTLVTQTVGWLAQIRQDNQQQFFLKLDSWHLPWLPLLRQAFPGTPCWFLYRHPLEILYSHHRQRGSQMVPGWLPPSVFRISPEAVNPADLDGYAAQVLEAIFSEAIAPAATGAIALVNYTELLQDPTGLLGRLGMALGAEDKMAVGQRCAYHSKNTGLSFDATAESVLPSVIRQHLEGLAAPRLLPLF